MKTICIPDDFTLSQSLAQSVKKWTSVNGWTDTWGAFLGCHDPPLQSVRKFFFIVLCGNKIVCIYSSPPFVFVSKALGH